MNQFDIVNNLVLSKTTEFLQTHPTKFYTIVAEATDFVNKITEEITTYRRTGVFKALVELEDVVEKENLDPETANNAAEEDGSNSESSANIAATSEPTSSRPKRHALQQASEKINQQLKLSLREKIRRPDENCSPYVKLEKLSINSQTSEDEPKSANEMMPAPTQLPARLRRKQIKKERTSKTEIAVKTEETKRITRTKSKLLNVVNNPEIELRTSDVIIQEVPVETVNLTSDDESQSDKEKGKKPKKGRKAKKTSVKRSRTTSTSPEYDKKSEKRSKSNGTERNDTSMQSVYHDAILNVTDKLADATYVHKNNETFVCTKQPTKANATFVLPKINNANDLITDDESEEEILPVSKRQIFSPFASSPVKKKVEAFEKLAETNTLLPPRTTRTKTRALAKQQEENEQSEVGKSVVKEKAKIFTPLPMKIQPMKSSTVQGFSKTNLSTLSTESSSYRSVSALKASQAEFRERERRRKEKEAEAARNREALLRAQIDEKKRKREEKQLKAQQQREQQEKEKLKALELQRLKEERHQRLLQEQEEQKQRQREELEKKRNLAKKRAMEEKRKEEERRLEEAKQLEKMKRNALKEKKKRLEEERKAEDEQKLLQAKENEKMTELMEKNKMQQKKPKFLTMPTPLLPTEDCYDSDDSNAGSFATLPDWCRQAMLDKTQHYIRYVGEQMKNTFYCVHPRTVNLREVFGIVDPRKLKRTSSAVWRKAPRYTLMPQVVEYSESSEED